VLESYIIPHSRGKDVPRGHAETHLGGEVGALASSISPPLLITT